jgi:hypothetical protein
MTRRAVDWKHVLAPCEGDAKEAEGMPGLYHLRDDPSESKDLATKICVSLTLSLPVVFRAPPPASGDMPESARAARENRTGRQSP